jgi:hypothetical protein
MMTLITARDFAIDVRIVQILMMSCCAFLHTFSDSYFDLLATKDHLKHDAVLILLLAVLARKRTPNQRLIYSHWLMGAVPVFL